MPAVPPARGGRTPAWPCLAVLAALATGCAALPPTATGAGGAHRETHEQLIPPRPGMPAPTLHLQDQHGDAFTTERLRGRWSVLFFGYTHCPDYCPTTLLMLDGAYRKLAREDADLAGRLQVVFVSVDPFRDTPAVLDDYLAYFNPGFIGATGAPADLRRLAIPLGANYSYADRGSGRPFADTRRRPAQDYTVNHAAGLYVFDERARLFARLAPPLTADGIERLFSRLREHKDGRR